MDSPQFLDDHTIPYSVSGKNVSKGWIGISCPFCGDQSNHLGINLEHLNYSCFVCGEKGYITKLIHTLLDVPYAKAKSLLAQYSEDQIIYEQQQRLRASSVKFDFPMMTWKHKEYLMRRRFDPDYLEQYYHLKSGGPVGKYMHRIIIPYIYGDQIVTFNARTIHDQSPKYLTASKDESVFTAKETLYGIDFCKKDRICLVEGPADVWRMGDGFAALSGINISPRQLLQVKDYSRVYIMLDSTASKEAMKVAEDISIMVKETYVVHLEQGDPGELTDEAAIEIRKELGI